MYNQMALGLCFIHHYNFSLSTDNKPCTASAFQHESKSTPLQLPEKKKKKMTGVAEGLPEKKTPFCVFGFQHIYSRAQPELCVCATRGCVACAGVATRSHGQRGSWENAGEAKPQSLSIISAHNFFLFFFISSHSKKKNFITNIRLPFSSQERLPKILRRR